MEERFRSGLEQKIAEQLTAAGVDYDFEGRRIPYTVPAREAKYLPDFDVPGGIILEGKGWFETAAERQKYILIRDSNPGIDMLPAVRNRANAAEWPAGRGDDG